MFRIPYISREAGVVILCILFVCLLLSTFFDLVGTRILTNPVSLQNLQECHRIVPDGGDCQAIGPRRPPWDCRGKIIDSLRIFIKVFKNRPFKLNGGGMRFEHSFAVWFMLRAIRPVPRTVIESGVHRGYGTWLIRQALPNAKIFSIDPFPVTNRENGTEYLTENNFKDFNNISWDLFNIDKDKAVVLFDDHQSIYRRIVEEGRMKGFRKFIIDDNYDYLHGDTYTIKWVCERKDREGWPGIIKDNFGKESRNTTWVEHYLYGEILRQMVRYYYEFPPIASVNLSKANIKPFTRSEKHRSTPLYITKDSYEKEGLDRFEVEYDYFSHISYVELEKSAVPF